MAWYNNKKEAEYKLPLEAGRKAVVELLEFYGIEMDDTPVDGKSPDEGMDMLCHFYRTGALENKQDSVTGFTVVQHLSSGQDLTYREMKGSDRIVIDRYDVKTQFNEKVNAILGKLSGLGEDVIAKLMRDDRRAASILSTIFFGV
jgi:hypothetical protein